MRVGARPGSRAPRRGGAWGRGLGSPGSRASRGRGVPRARSVPRVPEFRRAGGLQWGQGVRGLKEPAARAGSQRPGRPSGPKKLEGMGEGAPPGMAVKCAGDYRACVCCTGGGGVEQRPLGNMICKHTTFKGLQVVAQT